ncbi:hypothetical protein BpHYR1_000094 [Brachionus plicatilis]|uniref:LRAT domain-containing protein n=1 Tax=Brachionus plicatilis TaxID=10195 RepID=A0A3M7PPB7_BRAPC|nr:hypothetical protein BpHYR1_000094 [Brachionus plicatilis]
MDDTEFSKILSNSLPINVIKQIYDTTIMGQKYVIVVNKILWYKIRVFLREDHLDKRQKLTEYHWSEHATEEGVENHIMWIKERLKRTPLLYFDKMKSININYYFTYVKIDNECKLNPEKYFNAGDHLAITRKGGLYTHDCIYLGNKKVVHIFDENISSSKFRAKAKEDSWENFVGIDNNGNVPYWGTVYVVIHRLRIRKPDEIVKEAKELSSDDYAKGQYHFVLKNCQHFAAKCCTGNEFSIGEIGAFQFLNIMDPDPKVLSPLYSN